MNKGGRRLKQLTVLFERLVGTVQFRKTCDDASYSVDIRAGNLLLDGKNIMHGEQPMTMHSMSLQHNLGTS